MFDHISPHSVDDNNNDIRICIFESYIAKYVLLNQEIFKPVSFKVLDQLENLFTPHTDNHQKLLNLLAEVKPKTFRLEREIYSVFSTLTLEYPGYDSFQAIRDKFSLPAFNFLLKVLADNVLKPSIQPPHPYGMFSRRSPYSPTRTPELFSDSNRGVVEVELEESMTSKAIGIVADQYRPPELLNFYNKNIYPSMYLYKPNETSSVAKWLRNHKLPVISGSSGSTELLFSRILPLLELNQEEKFTLFFGQAMDMAAQGHHSFFECVIVAEHFKLETCLTAETDLVSFYLHWIPGTIKTSEVFHKFLNPLKSLLKDYTVNNIPKYDSDILNHSFIPLSNLPSSHAESSNFHSIARLTEVTP